MTKALALLAGLITYRLLSPSGFGEATLALSLMALGGFLLDSGLGAGLIRRVEEPLALELRALLSVQMFIAFGFISVLAVLAPLGLVVRLALVMALSLPFLALRGAALVRLERALDFKPVAQVAIYEAVSYQAVVIGLLLAGGGVWSLAWAQVVQAAVGTFVLLRASPKSEWTPTLAWSPLAPVLRFGLRFQALHATTIVREQAFNGTLGLVAGSHALGLWSFVVRLLLLPTMLLEALWRVSYPAVSARAKEGGDVADAIRRASGLCALALTWLIAPVLVVAPGLVPIVFGERWSPSVPTLFAAAGSFLVLGPISTAGLAALMLRDLARTVTLAVAASGVLSLVMVALLGERSLVVAGVAAAAGALLEALLLERAIRRAFAVSALAPTIVPLIIVLACTALGATLSAVLGNSLLGAAVALASALGALSLSTFAFQRATARSLLDFARRGA